MAKANRTIKQIMQYPQQYAAWFSATQTLFNQVAAFYFEVIQAHEKVLSLSSQKALNALEKLTHATNQNAHPVMPLDTIAPSIPLMFRRAAIHAALGSARSFSTNLNTWRGRKEKAETRSFMQPQRDPDTSPLLQHNNASYQKIIPWWQDLSPTHLSELALPAISDIPSQQVDVAIIGAGIAGLSAALSARSAGAQVIVLEKEAWLGYGATGRNAGILSAGINMSLSDLSPESPGYALWSETHQTLLSLIEDATQPSSLLRAHLTGAVSLSESKNAARLLSREAQARVAAGLNAELWTPAQVSSLTEGRLNTASVLSALWLPDEGRIQPLTLLAHLARQARRSGILIIGNTSMTNYQEVNNNWQITLADGRTLKARALIYAVGPTTQPNARIYALAFKADLPDTFPLFWDASPYTYADFRPGNGRLGVSGGRYGKAGVMRHDTRYHQHLAAVARHWLPELIHAQPYATWAVDLQVTADMVPTLRPLGKNAPGFSIEGLGALGVLPGIVLGKRAGTLVVL